MTNPTLELNEQVLMIHQPEDGDVDLSALAVNDILLINTRNSLYSFRIINAKVLLGELSKTMNGETLEAVLVGTLVKGQPVTTLRSTLQFQAQAIFLVLQDNRFNELITSPIVGLSRLTMPAKQVGSLTLQKCLPVRSVA